MKEQKIKKISTNQQVLVSIQTNKTVELHRHILESLDTKSDESVVFDSDLGLKLFKKIMFSSFLIGYLLLMIKK